MSEPTPSADTAPAAPRSPYARMGRPTPVRNVVWALSLTLAVVVVVAMLFFGVGNTPQRSVPESSRVDVAASAERAQEVAPFTLAVPSTDQGWTPQQARYADRADARWSVRYSSPSGRLVTLTQVAEVTPGLLQETIPAARTEGTVAVAGTSCELLVGERDDERAGEESAAPRALSCPADGSELLVSGTTDQDELERLAASAISSSRS